MTRAPRYRPPPCPECGAWADVIETRRRQTGVIARRCECANHHRFTTHETPEKEPANDE